MRPVCRAAHQPFSVSFLARTAVLMRWGRLAVVTFVAGVTAWPEIIDRIAVSVDRTVITESEVIRQIRITALLNGEQPDLSAANRRETAERLVEQALMRREIA